MTAELSVLTHVGWRPKNNYTNWNHGSHRNCESKRKQLSIKILAYDSNCLVAEDNVIWYSNTKLYIVFEKIEQK